MATSNNDGVFVDDSVPMIRDKTGEVRKLGTLANPAGFVQFAPSFASAQKPFTKQEIIAFLAEGQPMGRDLFGPELIANQRSHGSCQGYATARCLTRARMRNRQGDPILFSGAFVYSRCNGGRDNGSTLAEGMKVISTEGACPEDLVPWNLIYPRQQPSNAAAEAAKNKGFECYALDGDGNGTSELEIATAVALGYDIVVAVEANNAFMQLDSRGVPKSGNGTGNHATGVDGMKIDNGDLLFDMFNSWDVTYGADGRCYLTYDRHLAQTQRNHAFYAIRFPLVKDIDSPKVKFEAPKFEAPKHAKRKDEAREEEAESALT